jgi:hypothetical protein
MPSHGFSVDVETLMLNHRNRKIFPFDDQLNSFFGLDCRMGNMFDSIDQASVRWSRQFELFKTPGQVVVLQTESSLR